jgi:hypothetical protein
MGVAQYIVTYKGKSGVVLRLLRWDYWTCQRTIGRSEGRWIDGFRKGIWAKL